MNTFIQTKQTQQLKHVFFSRPHTHTDKGSFIHWTPARQCFHLHHQCPPPVIPLFPPPQRSEYSSASPFWVFTWTSANILSVIAHTCTVCIFITGLSIWSMNFLHMTVIKGKLVILIREQFQKANMQKKKSSFKCKFFAGFLLWNQTGYFCIQTAIKNQHVIYTLQMKNMKKYSHTVIRLCFPLDLDAPYSVNSRIRSK